MADPQTKDNAARPRTPKERTYLLYALVAGVVTGAVAGYLIGGAVAIIVSIIVATAAWSALLTWMRRDRKQRRGK